VGALPNLAEGEGPGLVDRAGTVGMERGAAVEEVDQSHRFRSPAAGPAARFHAVVLAPGATLN